MAELTIALVDRDLAYGEWLRRACWPDAVQVYEASPLNPAGDLVVWNLSRYPRDIGALMDQLCGQDPGRGVIIVWDDEPADADALHAHRRGALEAACRESIGDALRRFLVNRRLSSADDALHQELVERSAWLSTLSLALEGIAHSRWVEDLYGRAIAPLLELTGAKLAILQSGTEPADLVGIPPEVLRELDPASFEWRIWGDEYVAAVPLRALGRQIGRLWLVGRALRVAQLSDAGEFATLLCDQMALWSMASERVPQVQLTVVGVERP